MSAARPHILSAVIAASVVDAHDAAAFDTLDRSGRIPAAAHLEGLLELPVATAVGLVDAPQLARLLVFRHVLYKRQLVGGADDVGRVARIGVVGACARAFAHVVVGHDAVVDLHGLLEVGGVVEIFGLGQILCDERPVLLAVSGRAVNLVARLLGIEIRTVVIVLAGSRRSPREAHAVALGHRREVIDRTRHVVAHPAGDLLAAVAEAAEGLDIPGVLLIDNGLCVGEHHDGSRLGILDCLDRLGAGGRLAVIFVETVELERGQGHGELRLAAIGRRRCIFDRDGAVRVLRDLAAVGHIDRKAELGRRTHLGRRLGRLSLGDRCLAVISITVTGLQRILRIGVGQLDGLSGDDVLLGEYGESGLAERRARARHGQRHDSSLGQWVARLFGRPPAAARCDADSRRSRQTKIDLTGELRIDGELRRDLGLVGLHSHGDQRTRRRHDRQRQPTL